MAQGELGEKTEQPTSKRLSEARQNGQVAKSQDLGTAVDIIGGFILVLAFASTMYSTIVQVFHACVFPTTDGEILSADTLPNLIGFIIAEVSKFMIPFLLLIFLVAYLAQLLQVGWLFTTKPIQPRLNKLNPISGLKKIFSKRGLMKTAVNLLKLAVLSVVLTLLVRKEFDTIAGIALLDTVAAAIVIGRMIIEAVIWVLVFLLLIGLVDFAYQRWQHTQDLKMTKQDVKDEQKSMEGDLETKGRRLRMAREVAMQRIREAVPKADVVVTNPTHYAVALKYDQETMSAPMVLAKGADHLAFRIREIAAYHAIPIVERPALARALYAAVEPGQEVPHQHYEAVAEILAYVYRLNENPAA